MLSVVNVAFKMALSVHDIFKQSIKNKRLSISDVAWLMPRQGSMNHSEAQDPPLAKSSPVCFRQGSPLISHSPVSLPLASARAELNLQPTVTKPH